VNTPQQWIQARLYWSLAHSVLGLLEDWDVGIGVFPETEEVPIDSSGPIVVTRQSVSYAELKMGQCAYWIANHDAAVFENLLELDGGFGAPMCGNIGFTPHIDRIYGSKKCADGAARRPSFIRHCDFSCSIAFVESPWLSARLARKTGT